MKMTELEKGQIYQWREIVSNFPDMWAIISDDERVGGTGDIITCKVWGVFLFNDLNRIPIFEECLKKGMKVNMARTTFSGSNMGFLWDDEVNDAV